MSNAPRDLERSNGSAWRWGIPALIALIPLLIWPLGNLVWRAVAPDGMPSTETLLVVLRDPLVWQRLTTGVGQAFLSTLLSAAIGLPVAYVLSQLRFPGHGLVRFVATVPLVLPAIVVALAFRQLLGVEGWVSQAVVRAGGAPLDATRTLGAVVIAHAFFGVAIFARVVGREWARIDPRAEEAARVLGASHGRAFRYVTLPLLLPACRLAAALVFIFAFTSFAVVLLLGTTQTHTLEVTIYLVVAAGGSLSYAAVLSGAQLVVTVIALGWGDTPPSNVIRPPLRHERWRRLRHASLRERLVVIGVLVAIALLIALPIAALISAIARRGDLLIDASTRALGSSITFALGTAAIALLLAGLAGLAASRARGRTSSLLRSALILPIAVPPVVLALAYYATFDRDEYNLRGTPLLVLLAHVVIAYPLVLRVVVRAARAVDPRLAEAAAVLGATPRQAWRRIDLPLVSRALIIGALFAFVVSLGELGATMLLRRPAFTTAPVAILDALSAGTPDAVAQALALAAVLMVLTVIAFLFIERVGSRDAGEY